VAAPNGERPIRIFVGPTHPVESVNWDEASEFCRRLSARVGCNVRLPSEAEWEYACRAGTVDDFFFAPDGAFLDDTEIPPGIVHLLHDCAWFDQNSSEATQPVGLKRPNPWGLHDMIGNVWEWCADVWHNDYTGAPNGGGAWVADESRQPRRVLRGGAWDMNAFRCRSSYRSFDHRHFATSRIGFRLVAAL
jgi:formylglycine-generating enzyme required for sulfatase activity